MSEFVLANDYRTIRIEPQVLKNIIKNTEFATSKDDEDISLMNIAIEVSDDKVNAAGVSFEMISFVDAPKDSVIGNGNFYIMTIATRDFITLLDDINPVDIFSDEKVLAIKQSNFVYYFRMTNVSFPDWKLKVSMEFKNCLSFKKEEIINVIKQMKIMSPICRFIVEDDKVVINAIASDDAPGICGEGEEVIECQTTGSGLFMTINDLLIETFNRVVGPDIILYYNEDPRSPIKVRLDNNSAVLVSTLKE
jgi:DNA polymerase III sliding clamp (beta) subunit (PCNA family)